MPAPWLWFYWSTYQRNNAQNKPKTLGCSPHTSFWQIYLRSFCCCFWFFTQFLFPVPTKCIFGFKAKFIYLCNGFPGISLHTSYSSRQGTQGARPSLPQWTGQTPLVLKLRLNDRAQCGVTAICWSEADMTGWTTLQSVATSSGDSCWKNKAFSEEMKNKLLSLVVTRG